MLKNSQNEEKLINMDSLQTVEITYDRRNDRYSISCEYPDYAVIVGEYKTLSIAKKVLNGIRRTYSIGNRVFFMPQDQEEA